MAAIQYALSNHETSMMTSHVVLLLPVEFGNSYSWRWNTSIIIHTQNPKVTSPNMPMHA